MIWKSDKISLPMIGIVCVVSAIKNDREMTVFVEVNVLLPPFYYLNLQENCRFS